MIVIRLKERGGGFLQEDK
uniref:Uncharacterized protein n=1 Tax=Rhizophora mucronata TaxID=61149 RepID=A0A2P2M9J7_RHIMU